MSNALLSDTRLYRAWLNMRQRCYYQEDKSYKHYGGRGIKVCNEWLESSNLFMAWALIKGYRDGLTLDRVDSDGDYCPGNCRWVTFDFNRKHKRYHPAERTESEAVKALPFTDTQFVAGLGIFRVIQPGAIHHLLLSAQSAADLLGTQCYKIYKLMDSGKLPFVVIGKQRRITRATLLELFADSPQDTPDPVTPCPACKSGVAGDRETE